MFLCLSGFTGGGLEGVVSESPPAEFGTTSFLLMAEEEGGELCGSGLAGRAISPTAVHHPESTNKPSLPTQLTFRSGRQVWHQRSLQQRDGDVRLWGRRSGRICHGLNSSQLLCVYTPTCFNNQVNSDPQTNSAFLTCTALTIL